MQHAPSEHLTTTQLKLRTTPTAGLSGEQSPYYRRLLSAGYKGFLQGTVGGSTLYGVIGAGIGTLVALPLFATGAAPFAMALIPAMAGLGIYKGAGTFGNIGSFAAITAESAEMSEKRRYLLDRYYDLPDTPEYDAEAEQIRELLSKQHESKPPEHMFHGRPVLVGALLGGALALGFALFPPALAFLGEHIFVGELAHVVANSALVTPVIAVAGAALGALSGAVIGLDRYYVRNWLDKTANAMHDNKTIEQQLREREMEVAKLGKSQTPNVRNVDVTDIKTLLPPTPRSHEELAETVSAQRADPISPRQIAGLSQQPETLASSIEHVGKSLAPDPALQRASL